jgi:hypothetical protein
MSVAHLLGEAHAKAFTVASLHQLYALVLQTKSALLWRITKPVMPRI